MTFPYNYPEYFLELSRRPPSLFFPFYDEFHHDFVHIRMFSRFHIRILHVAYIDSWLYL